MSFSRENEVSRPNDRKFFAKQYFNLEQISPLGKDYTAADYTIEKCPPVSSKRLHVWKEKN